MIAELVRLHAGMMSGSQQNPSEGGELFADYYMNLVSEVAALRTKDAGVALAPAVAVSSGIARFVARQGDAGVAAVIPVLAQGYEVSSALETLGFAWFWADSTASPLSDSRE